MKKDKIAQFYQWSAEFVVAHGLWRKSRGRRPSMSYMGERNPEKAIERAILMSEDTQFKDLIIIEVNDDSFVREDGWSFWTPEKLEIVPKPGDIARFYSTPFYGRGIEGPIKIEGPIRGLFINGVKIFYRTEKEQAKVYAGRQLFLKEGNWI